MGALLLLPGSVKGVLLMRTALPQQMTMRYSSSSASCSSSRASSASQRRLKLTNPQFLLRTLSSSVRGHITFTLLMAPNLPNRSMICSSTVQQQHEM